MHNNEEQKNVSEEPTPSKNETQPEKDVDHSEAHDQKKEDVLEPPFGVNAQQAMFEQALKVLVAGISELMNRRVAQEGARSHPHMPRSETPMPPFGVPNRLLLEMCKTDKKRDNRQFRVGLGVGAMINMMGVHALSEDLRERP